MCPRENDQPTGHEADGHKPIFSIFEADIRERQVGSLKHLASLGHIQASGLKRGMPFLWIEVSLHNFM